MSKKMANQFACSQLILPEHRDQLHGHRQARRKEEERRLPCLDQQQWEEFEVLVKQSLGQGLTIRVTSVTKYHGRHSVTGQVIKVNPVIKRITLATPGGVQQVALLEIIGIEAAPGSQGERFN
ncbi:MAG TPA: YolD-like family protein [Firmicutes bacterium]|nr:YolD-like family protein [Bacillota bacterium]